MQKIFARRENIITMSIQSCQNKDGEICLSLGEVMEKQAVFKIVDPMGF